MPPKHTVPRANPLLLVALAAIAAAAQPVLGTFWLGVLLSVGFGVYGALAVRAGQRVIGALFVIAALAIAVALVVQ